MKESFRSGDHAWVITQGVFFGAAKAPVLVREVEVHSISSKFISVAFSGEKKLKKFFSETLEESSRKRSGWDALFCSLLFSDKEARSMMNDFLSGGGEIEQNGKIFYIEKEDLDRLKVYFSARVAE